MDERARTRAVGRMRRLVRGFALAGTLLVGVVAIALIVSQTPWFRDWLRRYIVRESRQYLNGELTIGGLGGNLFFGVKLQDVAVDISGTRVIAVKGLEVDYNVFHLISEGVVVDTVTLVEPLIRLERNAEGWNVRRLLKEQRRDADRRALPPITLRSIRIADAAVDVNDRRPSKDVHIPARIEDLDIRAAYAYQPTHSTIAVEHLSFRAESPQFALRQLAGRLALRDDDLHIEGVVLHTDEAALDFDGVIEDYLRTPVLKLAAKGHFSLQEIARVFPAAAEYRLTPVVSARAVGPLERLALDFEVQSEAGHVDGRVTADVRAPGHSVEGSVQLARLDLAPLLRDPSQRSDVSGRGTVDLRLAAQPEKATALERLSGTFRFTGPLVAAAGYEAANVVADGAFESGRIKFSATADAYGGSGTAAGFVRPATPGRPVEFELHGRADGIHLKNLPRSTGAPALETNLAVADYEVRGERRVLSGRVALNRSTVAGATIEEGTVGEFTVRPGDVAYGVSGRVAGLNLRRIGQALDISALDRPLYDSQIAGRFDVTASGTTLDRLVLEASGTLTDAAIVGTRIDDLAFEARLKDGGLDVTLEGGFAGFNPALLTERPALEGQISGTVDARVGIADLTVPVTVETVNASGQVQLTGSTLGGLTIDRATVHGEYANRVGDITTLEVISPDLIVKASGRLALDRSSESALTYQVEATDVNALAQLAGQKGMDGSAVLTGRISGNAASLATTGTLKSTSLTYGNIHALDLNSTYKATVPEVVPADVTVEASTSAKSVNVDKLQLSQLTATTTYAANQIAFWANATEQSRELDARGQVILHPDHQEIRLLDLAVRAQGIEWRTVEGADTAIQYGQDRLTLQNVRLVNGEQSLAVEGTLALRGERPSAILDVKADSVDLAQFERLLLQNRGTSGRLNADARISGTAQQPVVDGRVEIRDGGFRGYQFQSLVADLDYDKSRIAVDATLRQSPTEAITARGTVPTSVFSKGAEGHVAVSEHDNVDLRIQSSDLALGVVQGLTTAVTNVRGTLQADVQVTGSARDPHLAGYIDIRNGAFSVPAGGVAYTGLDTRLDFATDFVSIRSFEIADDGGHRLSVSGRLAVHEGEGGAVDVTIESRNFEVIDNELGDVGLDSKLKITGELRRPRIEGEIRPATARVEVDQVLQLFYDPYSIESLPSVASADRTVEGSGSAEEATRQSLARAKGAGARAGEATAAVSAEAPAAGPFDPVIDVHVVIPDNLVLRGNALRPGGPTGAAIGDLNATLGGDLRVRRASGGPVTLVGTVTTVRGTYEFRRRRFDLVRGGTLLFGGERDINPIVDLTAVREIPDTGVEARIRVTGTAKAPQLALSSTPPLEQSDILALIIFNRPVNELGSGERASLAATAGGIATGFIAAPLGESIGRALDLDLFEITTTTDDGGLGAGLIVGHQVGDRAFVKLQQQFGRQNISEFLLEYRLTDFMRMRASATPETAGSANRLNQRRIERAGIDLIFFFSY